MKQTEIGLIPEDWEVKKIKEISVPVRGGSPRPAGSPLYFNGDFIPWLTVASLTNISLSKIFVESTEAMLTELGSNYSRKLSKGTLIISNSGATLGVAKILGIDCCANDGIAALLNLNADNKFLTYYINSLTDYLRNSVATGNGQPNLNTDLIGNLQIPLPPLAEQEAIANALSDADAWIEKLEQLIAKKRLIKQGSMQTLLTPKDGWEVKNLGEVIDVYRGGSPRPIQDFITNKPDGINWIKIGDTSASGKYITSANEKIIPEGEKNSRKVFVGDFLLSNSMSFGRPYILKIEGCIHDGWLVLQNYQVSFNTEFLYYLLTSKFIIDQYKSKAAGSSVLNLNKELVSSVNLLIPSLSEQERIATILSDMDEEIEALEQQLGKARHIKQGMMQELLTGRVRLEL